MRNWGKTMNWRWKKVMNMRKIRKIMKGSWRMRKTLMRIKVMILSYLIYWSSLCEDLKGFWNKRVVRSFAMKKGNPKAD